MDLCGASIQRTINWKVPVIRLDMYPAGGLMWKGESAQNTNWNKITETPDGKVWFCGGDHWGTDHITGPWSKGESYERPWGFGNTTISYYDPKQKKSFVATDEDGNDLELNRSSAIYSNTETPGHGKSHSNITSDSRGRIYYAGYMGLSYRHEYTRAHYPKSYAGGALVRYDPATKDVDYFGIPYPNGGIVGIYYDEKRNIINGITVDRAKFFRVNLTTMELNHYESIARMSRVEDRVREMIMDRNGFCYFANDVGGLTKFDPDKETFTDIDITLPGKLSDFRARSLSRVRARKVSTFREKSPYFNNFMTMGQNLGRAQKAIFNRSLQKKKTTIHQEPVSLSCPHKFAIRRSQG